MEVNLLTIISAFGVIIFGIVFIQLKKYLKGKKEYLEMVGYLEGAVTRVWNELGDELKEGVKDGTLTQEEKAKIFLKVLNKTNLEISGLSLKIIDHIKPQELPELIENLVSKKVEK